MCNQSQPLFTAWALLPSQAKGMLCPAPSRDCRMLPLALLDKSSPILARFSGLPPNSSLKCPKASFFLNEYFSKNKNSQDLSIYLITAPRNIKFSRKPTGSADGTLRSIHIQGSHFSGLTKFPDFSSIFLMFCFYLTENLIHFTKKCTVHLNITKISNNIYLNLSSFFQYFV